MTRDEFRVSHPDVFLLDADDPVGLTAYLRARGWLAADEPVVSAFPPGDGNMNYTLRIVTPGRSFIVKQSRPWVEKYDQIPAPWDRALVEARFYEGIVGVPAVQRCMPRLLGVDRRSRVLMLEDLGDSRDLTSLYEADSLSDDELDELVAYLGALHRMSMAAEGVESFANRDMRALNHEYIFLLPLAPESPVDLDGITPGLAEASQVVRGNAEYIRVAAELGDRYLADGRALLHGDYFPGSWLRAEDGIKIIDPEFCFLGDPSFDLGVFMAHLVMADQPARLIDRVIDRYARDASWDEAAHRRSWQFAGIEIMRRLIGVARVPVTCGLEAKAELLERSRRLVLEPSRARL